MTVPTDAALIQEYDRWFRERPDIWVSPERNRFMLDAISQYPDPKMVLDIGCGNGHTLKAVQEHYPNCILYAMDISQEALALVEDKVDSVYAIHDFIDKTSLGLRFDWVLCMGVAEHFQRLGPSLRRMKSLTGGYCYLEIPNCLSYSPGEPGFRRLSCGSRQWEWHLLRQTWEEKLVRSGFEIVEALVGKDPTWEFVWVLK